MPVNFTNKVVFTVIYLGKAKILLRVVVGSRDDKIPTFDRKTQIGRKTIGKKFESDSMGNDDTAVNRDVNVGVKHSTGQCKPRLRNYNRPICR